MIYKLLNKINIIYGITIIIFAVIHVVLLNQDSTYGQQLTDLQVNEAEILNQNLHLNQKIASVSALSSIVIKANIMGLTEKQNIVYISTSVPIAYNNSPSL